MFRYPPTKLEILRELLRAHGWGLGTDWTRGGVMYEYAFVLKNRKIRHAIRSPYANVAYDCGLLTQYEMALEAFGLVK